MSIWNLNKCAFVGHLGADPELRYTGTGTAVCNFSLAINRPKLPNQQKQMTDWVKMVIFGKAAEVAQEHLKKGRRVYVEGRLQTRSYEDSQGSTRYVTEVVSNSFSFVDAPKQNGNEEVPPVTDSDIPAEENKDETLDDLPDFE